MRARTFLSTRARQTCSVLMKLIDSKPFIQGKWVVMPKLCGKAGCRCTKGDRHVSCYISLRYRGKRTMIYIPHQLEADARQQVKNSDDLKIFIESVSNAYLEKLIQSKKRSSKV